MRDRPTAPRSSTATCHRRAVPRGHLLVPSEHRSGSLNRPGIRGGQSARIECLIRRHEPADARSDSRHTHLHLPSVVLAVIAKNRRGSDGAGRASCLRTPGRATTRRRFVDAHGRRAGHQQPPKGCMQMRVRRRLRACRRSHLSGRAVAVGAVAGDEVLLGSCRTRPQVRRALAVPVDASVSEPGTPSGDRSGGRSRTAAAATRRTSSTHPATRTRANRSRRS